MLRVEQILGEQAGQQPEFWTIQVNECVFYRRNTRYVLYYIDYSLLPGPDKDEIDKATL